MPAQRKHISFTEETYKIIDEASEENDLPFSTQVNQIVKAWHENRKAMLLIDSLRNGIIDAITPHDVLTVKEKPNA
jgi:superfamily II DNA/RNA helicase